MNYRFTIQRTPRPRKKVQYRLELSREKTVLDALFMILHQQDSSLAFRCACRVGMCGSCAMEINGVPRLACQMRAEALGTEEIRLAPLRHLPVLRDLIVSLDPFIQHWRQILPALHARDPQATVPAIIPADSPYMRHTQGRRDCITCGACYAACGIPAFSRRYLGPAAINKALLRNLDSRDAAHAERAQALDDAHAGVWRCHTQYNCGAVCPKGIDLTDSIGFFKRAFSRRVPAS